MIGLTLMDGKAVALREEDISELRELDQSSTRVFFYDEERQPIQVYETVDTIIQKISIGTYLTRRKNVHNTDYNWR